MLKMYYEYQPLQVENLKFNLDNKFWLSLLLSKYNIMYVKTFASSPTDTDLQEVSNLKLHRLF